MAYEYIPPDRRTNHLAVLGDGARQLWYRLEYLNWTIEAPGVVPLGDTAFAGQRQPFQGIDLDGDMTPDFIPFGEQPNSGLFDLNKNNGIRFALGVPTATGDLEANVWVLDQADSLVRVTPFHSFDTDITSASTIDDPTMSNLFPATAFFAGIIRHDNFQASLKTDVFGTEANFVFNPVTPNQPLTFRPMVGFQFINYREAFLLSGRRSVSVMVEDPDDPTTALPADVTLTPRIDARARNNIYAPQIGVRAEFAHEWFTFSVTPKFMLGFNRRKDELRTSQLRFVDQNGATELLLFDEGARISDALFQNLSAGPSSETRSFFEELASEFAPSFDLKLEARVHVNEHFSLFASYQLYVLSNISRPLGNVDYSPGGNQTMDPVVLNTLKQHQLWIDGYTVGGELRFH